MSKKHTLKKAAALFLGLALTVGATGCNFIVTDSEKDLAQTVAKVDITETLKTEDAYKNVANDVAAIIENEGLSTDIPKRDLIAYYLNVGYQYVESYGYSYEDTFNMLMDGLVNRKIMTQYAVAYYLSKNSTMSAAACEKYIDDELAKIADTEIRAMFEKHPEVLTMKYFLTDGGKGESDKTDEYDPLAIYDKAVYNLKKSLNDSFDSAEANYIKAETDDHTHEETRTTPTNANAETDDYYTTDYEVYTGRNAAGNCGEYERVDGSTTTTRQKAYNAFLSNLLSYGLVKDDENLSDLYKLNYYYEELASSLGQALVNKYFEDLQDEAIAGLTDEVVANKYQEILSAQEASYGTDATAFDTALDSVSDNKFVLYGQKGFGFVYNILLPFSTSQERAYAAAKNKGLDENGVFNARKEILAQIEATDLRTAWFCQEDSDSNYAFDPDAEDSGYTGTYYKNANVSANTGKNYLFFKNNVTDTENKRYQSLGQYAGQYPYNGQATYDADTKEWDFTPNKLTIDSFMDEMKAYIEYAAEGTSVVFDNGGAVNPDYTATDYDENNDGIIEYNKFVYKSGKVDGLGTVNASDFFNKTTKAYQALSAVNELMFAYSTDTGCLNTYMGYVVSPYTTEFVAEFEYAAQVAVNGIDRDNDGVKEIEGGVGTFVVAPSDYGWHIIYTTFVYDGGDVYGGFKPAEKETEGTFSYLFYESLKSTSASNYTNEVQSVVLKQYKDSAELYTKRYQDLLDMD